jgi:hypothetical protein
VPLVPSYSKLRKLERQISSAVGSLEPIDEVSPLGNNFSVLDPRQTIALVSGFFFLQFLVILTLCRILRSL